MFCAEPELKSHAGLRVNLNSDSSEATSTAFPLAEAGLRVVSLNSDLEATPVLPSCAEPKLTHAHTSRVVAEATVSRATCWTAGEP